MLSNIQIYQYCDGYTDTLKVTARSNIFAWRYLPKKILAWETGEIKLKDPSRESSKELKVLPSEIFWGGKTGYKSREKKYTLKIYID